MVVETEQRVSLNSFYAKSRTGIVRLAEIVLSFVLCFLAGLYSNCWLRSMVNRRIHIQAADCDSIFAWPFDSRYWGAMLVVVLAAVTLIISTIFYVIRLFDRSLDPKSEIIYTVCSALNFVVATAVMAWLTDLHFYRGPIQYLYPQGIAASIIAAFVAVLYALDSFLLYRKHGF